MRGLSGGGNYWPREEKGAFGWARRRRKAWLWDGWAGRKGLSEEEGRVGGEPNREEEDFRERERGEEEEEPGPPLPTGPRFGPGPQSPEPSASASSLVAAARPVSGGAALHHCLPFPNRRRIRRLVPGFSHRRSRTRTERKRKNFE